MSTASSPKTVHVTYQTVQQTIATRLYLRLHLHLHHSFSLHHSSHAKQLLSSAYLSLCVVSSRSQARQQRGPSTATIISHDFHFSTLHTLQLSHHIYRESTSELKHTMLCIADLKRALRNLPCLRICSADTGLLGLWRLRLRPTQTASIYQDRRSSRCLFRLSGSARGFGVGCGTWCILWVP